MDTLWFVCQGEFNLGIDFTARQLQSECEYTREYGGKELIQWLCDKAFEAEEAEGCVLLDGSSWLTLKLHLHS